MAKNNCNAICGPSDTERAKWRAEDDYQTLVRAQEVRKDAARFKAAKAIASEKIKAAQAALNEGK